MNAKVNRIINAACAGEELSPREVAALVGLDPTSSESYLMMAAARRMSVAASGGLAEVHAQVGINLSPCPKDCAFCAFARCNGMFDKPVVLSDEEVTAGSLQFEADGANAIFLMTTADYAFDDFLSTAAAVRSALKPETVMVANVGDFDRGRAVMLKEAGFAGVYHAVRLGEGVVTHIPIDRRLRTFEAAHQAGLKLGTCLEPVGPEHTTEELVEKILITKDASPCYSGAGRRITIPSSSLAKHGMITELRTAQLVAATRLALGTGVIGNCTHEPCTIGAMAGANLFWAEVGGNPRDTEAETAESRGRTVVECRKMFEEAGLQVLDGPSRMYGGSGPEVQSASLSLAVNETGAP